MNEKETGILILSLCLAALGAGLFFGFFFGSINGFKRALREAEHYKLGEWVVIGGGTNHKEYRWKWNGQEWEEE